MEELMEMLKSIPEEATILKWEDGFDEDMKPVKKQTRYIDRSKYDASELYDKMLAWLLDDELEMHPIRALEMIENGFRITVIHESEWEAAVQVTVPGMEPPLTVIAIS